MSETDLKERRGGYQFPSWTGSLINVGLSCAVTVVLMYAKVGFLETRLDKVESEQKETYIKTNTNESRLNTAEALANATKAYNEAQFIEIKKMMADMNQKLDRLLLADKRP